MVVYLIGDFFCYGRDGVGVFYVVVVGVFFGYKVGVEVDCVMVVEVVIEFVVDLGEEVGFDEC